MGSLSHDLLNDCLNLLGLGEAISLRLGQTCEQ
jgi:hypothetical protein